MADLALCATGSSRHSLPVFFHPSSVDLNIFHFALHSPASYTWSHKKKTQCCLTLLFPKAIKKLFYWFMKVGLCFLILELMTSQVIIYMKTPYYFIGISDYIQQMWDMLEEESISLGSRHPTSESLFYIFFSNAAAFLSKMSKLWLTKPQIHWFLLVEIALFSSGSRCAYVPCKKKKQYYIFISVGQL